jgi:hypothetical protein
LRFRLRKKHKGNQLQGFLDKELIRKFNSSQYTGISSNDLYSILQP